jgi:site-specific DNA-methyltransferase (adenine-specific)
MHPISKVIHGDCLAGMRRLSTGSVNLVVTDPPYEIKDLSMYFVEMVRVLSPTGSLYCFGDKDVIAGYWFAQVPLAKKTLLIWHYKNSPKPKGRWRLSYQGIIYGYRSESPFFEDEVRIPYTEGAKKLNGRMRPSNGRLGKAKAYDTSRGALPRDVIEVPALLGHRSSVRYGHPDQKPQELIEKLICASSLPGQLVLDPFGGTGTTAAAAKALDRNFITFEQDKRWADVIRARLKESRDIKHREDS